MKKKQRSQQQIAIDAGLEAENLRVMQQARDVFGVDELNAETALLAAKNIRSKLAGMTQEVRLANEQKILAVMSNLNDLRDRLHDEKLAVEDKLILQKQNKNANLAYASGGMSCLRK